MNVGVYRGVMGVMMSWMPIVSMTVLVDDAPIRRQQ